MQMKCAHESCTATFEAHRWGKTRAQSSGWFLQRDNVTAWCPEHIPEWVATWRALKQEKK
jgi:hypothetical protein